MRHKLRPIHDNAKSFYNKAEVKEEDNTKTLYSYDTIVAQEDQDGILTVYGYYSDTTQRHINEFLTQNGYEPIPTKDLKTYGKIIANRGIILRWNK